MPRLSLYRSEKTNDYKYLDKNIKEMFTIGATDLYVHKYLGTVPPSSDSGTPDPMAIQDLLFMENRDRKYDADIYRIRGHYNVQNLDFDLSQFGLFLNNDIIFITVHYNDMIELIGRKLMVGDVFELPHLTDYHPLNETIPVGLRRYYQITDANFASEGFSSTWYPHLWRIKCEPLVDSQEYSQILDTPLSQDNYLGEWSRTATYVPGYVITFGGKNYTATQNVPAGIMPPDPDYWELDLADNIRDVLSRYNKNIEINDANLEEARKNLPKSGYDRSSLYVTPIQDNGQPAAPVDLVTSPIAPRPTRGTLQLVRTNGFSQASPVVRVPASAKDRLKQLAIQALQAQQGANLQVSELAVPKTDSNSGRVSGDLVLSVTPMGTMPQPYGSADTIAARTDQDPTQPNFDGIIIPDIMDYRADTDPRFRYIVRTTPKGYGYSEGYLAGDGTAPNGEPFGTGITFPSNPMTGDYFLRIDYLPQQMFRWDGKLWVKISENSRTGVGMEDGAGNQRASFINNSNVTVLSDGVTTIPERQSLSSILRIQPD